MVLTVGYVSGIINAVILIVHITFPLIVGAIVVGVLAETNNAATWSVLGRLLNSSYWPEILRTDSVANRTVSKRVALISTVLSLALLILAIASPVTPLGLSTTISSRASQGVQFHYVADASAIGQATTSHSDYTFNRICGGNLYINCPGSNGGYTTFENATGVYAIPNTTDPYISSAIAWNITDAFTSATSQDGNTIAGIFDIQFRSFLDYNDASLPTFNKSHEMIDQGRPRTQGTYDFLQSMILDNKYEAIDGLVVDTISGGVGFRNQTLPPSTETGFQWEEDLLWIEPETVCVDLNITLDYMLAQPGSAVINGRLTDRGGLSNVTSQLPPINLSDPQNNPALYQRAWSGAVLTNFNLLRYYNETHGGSFVGKTYDLGLTFLDLVTPNAISFTEFQDSPSGPTLPNPFQLVDNSTANVTFNSNGTTNSTKYLKIGLLTEAFGGLDNANISNIMVQTGLILGAGTQIDSSGNPVTGFAGNRLDPGSNWTQPLYSCASALKASVKRVSFQANGTASLTNLEIMSVQPVNYTSADTQPHWAVENTGLNIGDVNPLWGIVSPDYATSPHLYTIQSDSLYLPAGMNSIFGILTGDSVAGAEAPNAALYETFNVVAGETQSGFPDYSGRSSYAMFLKWKGLSARVDTVGSISNLIWTDLMANFVTSSQSILSRNNTSPLTSAVVNVTPFEVAINYDYIYAIPALLFAAFYIMSFLALFALLFSGHVRFSTLRMLTNQTSGGRAAVTERFRNRYSLYAGRQEWIDNLGKEMIDIRVKRGRGDYTQVNASEARDDTSHYVGDVHHPQVIESVNGGTPKRDVSPIKR